MDGRNVPREHGDPDDPDAEDAERNEEASPFDDAPQEERGGQDQDACDHRDEEHQPVRLDHVAVRRLRPAQVADRVGERAVVPSRRIQRFVRDDREQDTDTGDTQERARELPCSRSGSVTVVVDEPL